MQNKSFIQALLISIRNREPARRVGVRRTNPRSLIRDVMTPADWWKRGRTIEAPAGGSPTPGLLAPDTLLSKIDSAVVFSSDLAKRC